MLVVPRSARMLAFVSLFAALAAATATTCNPSTATATCASVPAMPSSITYDLSSTDSNDLTYVMPKGISSNGTSLEFTLTAQGDAPTIITNDYLLYGNVKATVKSAPGVGMVSAFILMSDVLDEIDLEWLGAYDNEVQTNYYHRGDATTYDRGGVSTVATPELTTHVYEIDWTETRLIWSIDGVAIRTLNAADTATYGYPSTPSQIKVGVWASGDPSNSAGTIEWGGGPINYAAGPYTMTLSSLQVTSYTTAKSFSYTNGGQNVVISQDGASTSSSPSSSRKAPSSSSSGGTTTPTTAVAVVRQQAASASAASASSYAACVALSAASGSHISASQRSGTSTRRSTAPSAGVSSAALRSTTSDASSSLRSLGGLGLSMGLAMLTFCVL